MRAKDLHSVLIPFGTILGASAIAVLGNDDGFTGKSGMNLVEIACGFRCRTWHPSSEILISLDKVHKPGDIALRRSDHEAARNKYLEALSLYERIPDPYGIGVTHERLATIADGEARASHVAAARAAWTSIDRSDLVASLK